MATPGEFLFSQFDKSIAQIPGPEDPLERALKQAKLKQMDAALQIEERRQRDIAFEQNMTLYSKIGQHLPDKGRSFLQNAVSAIAPGMEIPPEFAEQGGQLLTLVAETLSSGQPNAIQLAAGYLDAGEKAGFYRSRKELQDAVAYRDFITRQQAEQAAKAVSPLPVEVELAKKRMHTYQTQPDLWRDAYGTPPSDYVGSTKDWYAARYHEDALIAEKGEEHIIRQERLKHLFTMNPAAMQAALNGQLARTTDPKELASDQAFNILTKPEGTRTEEENRFVDAYTFRWGTEAMQKARGMQTAAMQAQEYQRELAEIQGRRAMVQEAFAMEGDAQHDAAEITAGVNTYKGGLGANPTVEEVKGARIQIEGLMTRLKGARDAYMEATGGAAKRFSDDVVEYRKRHHDLLDEAQNQTPAQKKAILLRADEADKLAQASQAAHSLLTDLSPYALAQAEAEVSLLESEVADRKATGEPLDDVQAELTQKQELLRELRGKRKDARDTVQAEQYRLMDRERMTQAKRTAADRQAEEQELLKRAGDAAVTKILKGAPYSRALAESAKDYGVMNKAKDLRLNVDAVLLPMLEGAAQREVEAGYLALQAKHQREPTQAELLDVVNQVASKPQYKELDRKKLMENLQAKPLVELNLPPQERAFEAELGKAQVHRLSKSLEAAEEAAEIITTVNEGRKLLSSGMVTGFGAETLVTIGQALKQIGFDAQSDATANAQAYASTMAQNVGKLIKQFGTGTGLSDADREYAEKMAGGKITLDKNAIVKILDINERAARSAIRKHNQRVKGIQTNIPLEVTEPPPFQAPGTVGPFQDAEKERRYQEWRKQQGQSR